MKECGTNLVLELKEIKFMENKKITFLAIKDYANVLTEYSYCLNKCANKIESKSICTIPHKFKYKIKHDYNINKCNTQQLQEVKNWISMGLG